MEDGAMIRIRNLVLPFDHGPDALESRILARLNIDRSRLIQYEIVRKSLDARKKEQIRTVYTVDAAVTDAAACLKRLTGENDVGPAPDTAYRAPGPKGELSMPPVVAGSGPCGLFAALVLAEAGCRPIVIERGKPVSERLKDVNRFWKTGDLDPESNVCYGEGGAGTFSDGKLTTQIKDKHNRIRKVLSELAALGADAEILYQAKPHIGSDRLVRIVKNLRNKILALGGQVLFQHKLTGIETQNRKVRGVVVNNGAVIATEHLVLACGHSARDTYEMLSGMAIPMSPKPFSMGVRIEHPQAMVDQAQYGKLAGHPMLGPADYKLVCHCPDHRSVYTFCMCPGGKVIASSSEKNGVVTNGMSLSHRRFENANSALLVNVTPDDFSDDHPLAGLYFQRKWEQRAFVAGGKNYFAPAQQVGDFITRRASASPGQVVPSYRPGVTCCDLRECLPGFVADALEYAVVRLDRTLKGFAMADAMMTAIETRSSAPVRIARDATFQSPALAGFYPAGEGAGHAGGIVSSAVDGIRAAEAILSLKS